MEASENNRLSRLTAILTQLQTRRLVTAPELAAKYGVSVRTIYRDIRSLERSGVPIATEEGKGYALMEHYRLPPVAFTEAEANALVLAEQLVHKTSDSSFVTAYAEAVDKIKAVLRYDAKDKANLLHQRTTFDRNLQQHRSSNNLSALQDALTNYRPARITYTNASGEPTERVIEPFALLSTENWLLIAWCRLRQGFRYFRLDRIGRLTLLSDTFTPHGMTLQQFFDRYHPGQD
ncbi:HTH domain-containing protein [Neolewinella xylanilytica]|uniref:HTH domain-containing protein n=1 Tax=Neolewinella xylanilytica TaxID=1514080 RepID=A0A2S6I6Y1_9BACT|nr:YafY family protein [Neolewinella xylanilytica]PPK87240.1 HTH domain-containing protein [Neolewinella xylanilytica]